MYTNAILEPGELVSEAELQSQPDGDRFERHKIYEAQEVLNFPGTIQS